MQHCPGTVPVSPAPLTLRLTGKCKLKALPVVSALAMVHVWPPALGGTALPVLAGSGDSAEGVPEVFSLGGLCAAVAGWDRQGAAGAVASPGRSGREPRRGCGARLVRGRLLAVQLVPPPARLPAHA